MKIFISYAHEDEPYKIKLLKQLSHLQREGIIDGWHDSLIIPGGKWDNSIKKALYECEVVLFLISADFIASEYINNTEIKISLDRYEKGEIEIIPVILRPCLWRETKFRPFQTLPKDAKALSTWENEDEGLLNIAEGIAKLVKTQTNQNSEEKDKTSIVIQDVGESTITVNVDGQIQELTKKLDDLIQFMKTQQSQSFQTADKIYNIDSIKKANFDYIFEQFKHEKKLPEELADDLITNDTIWVNSLKRELQKLNVPVRDKSSAIFQHYGWLIEVFLQKINTPAGKKRTLRRLSFMAEAFQSSLRYLCYIQLAQVLINQPKKSASITTDFFNMSETELTHFDWLNFLITSNNLLANNDNFIEEIPGFIAELIDSKSDLYGVALFLEKNRQELLKGKISEDESLDRLLNEYLTALVFWLRKIAFLSTYRLVSIKDINLNYRLGSAKNFVHLYGELHGMYSEIHSNRGDFVTHSIQDHFTYNQSVLLFKGRDITTSLNNLSDNTGYLSLSPLLIDQSVFVEKETQTPEVYYYIGKDKRCYHFAQYKNELLYGTTTQSTSNKTLKVKVQNNNQPKLDELFEQMEKVLKPFKTPPL